MSFSTTLEKLKSRLEELSAVEVAELFLSPHIDEKILNEATAEAGPAMWIVNRSDIADATLEKLLRHKISGISERAAEKIKSRKATITHLSSPIIEEDLSRVDEYAIEDILGHPLCPWEAMLFYAIHPNEDTRSSACLSLARRLWEHPAQSQDFPLIESQMKDVFSVLAAEDISPMVRAYAARIKMWTENEIEAFTSSEQHPHVMAKWIQHEASPKKALSLIENFDDPYLRRVIALDKRLDPALRKKHIQNTQDTLEQLIHEAYITL